MFLQRLLWWRPPCVLRTVLVNMKHDPEVGLRGLLWGYRGSWLTLREADMLKANTAPAHLDGEIVIHRDNVAFLQVLP